VNVTAIIPATNDPPTLERCLDAIAAADDPPEQTIVVTTPRGAGPAAARNRGARVASGDVLVFVDADVVAHRDAFSRIRAAFESDRDLAAVFGSYDDSPHHDGTVSSFRNLLHHHVHQTSAGPAATFWAGLGAIRRDAFLGCGGFDSDRFPRPSVEDIELGMRLADRGLRMTLDSQLLGTHLKRWSVAGMVRTDLRDRGIPWVALLVRRRAGSSSLNLHWRHRASALATVAAAISLARRRPRPLATAAGTLVALNRDFYALLWRRRGARHALAGVLLHALHLGCAAVAVPLGVGSELRRRA